MALRTLLVQFQCLSSYDAGCFLYIMRHLDRAHQDTGCLTQTIPVHI